MKQVMVKRVSHLQQLRIGGSNMRMIIFPVTEPAMKIQPVHSVEQI